jgi:hypothetical protein
VTGTLYHGCAIIDHPTRSLAPEMATLVTDGQLDWLGPAEEAPDPGPGVEVVDAGGTTAVAAMVDAHSHLPCLAEPTGSTGPATRPTGCWLARTGSLPSGGSRQPGWGDSNSGPRPERLPGGPLRWRPDLRFLNTRGDRW